MHDYPDWFVQLLEYIQEVGIFKPSRHSSPIQDAFICYEMGLLKDKVSADEFEQALYADRDIKTLWYLFAYESFITEQEN